MRGVLEDVFEITARGTVVFVQVSDGHCLIGDTLVVGKKQWRITGIEMINYNEEGRRRLSEGWIPPLGILLGCAKKSDLVEYIGSEVGTVEQRKSEQ